MFSMAFGRDSAWSGLGAQAAAGWIAFFCSTRSHFAVQDRILQYKVAFCSTRSLSAVQDGILQCKIVFCSTRSHSAVQGH